MKSGQWSLTSIAVKWRCELTSYQCSKATSENDADPSSQRVTSRDGRYTAFVRNHNLYVRLVASGEEIQVTSDGARFYEYATPIPLPSMMMKQGTEDVIQPPAVFWSPNSKRLVTYVMDRRGLPLLTMTQAQPSDRFRPRAYSYTYPLPGDPKLPVARPFIFDIEQRKVIQVDVAPIEMFTFGGPRFTWFADGNRFYYKEIERGYKRMRLLEVHSSTGRVRPVIDERSETPIDSFNQRERMINEASEVIWSSERDGWNHLYLYDVATGSLKNQITKGEWVVRQINHVDEKNRQLYFSALGREPGRDPYLRHFYRINLDGSGLTLLTPEDADHGVSVSPDGKYFTDSRSRVGMPTISTLRLVADGSIVRELEKADMSRLNAMFPGLKAPEPFKAKGSDGKTDVYGVIWRPSNFDPNRKYPVLETIYTGPHAAFTPKTFDAYRSQLQSTAELGFICVMVDGRGTGFRSRAFREASYKNLGGAGIEDHIAWLKQAAARYPYMDLSRVGIWGHSAGGYDSTHALLTHPEIYKAAVSSAGNHDHRLDKVLWVENWMGYGVDKHYVEQSNVTLAHRLQGKLFLIHGEIDENVPVSVVLKLVDALIKANKDFDLLIVPNENHAIYGVKEYIERRRWDFFVKHILGVNPPEGYEIKKAVE